MKYGPRAGLVNVAVLFSQCRHHQWPQASEMCQASEMSGSLRVAHLTHVVLLDETVSQTTESGWYLR